MFTSFGSILAFLGGLALTLGLLLSLHLVPGGYGYRMGLSWPAGTVAAAAFAGLAVLAGVLWLAGRWVRDARSWKETRVIVSALLIAGVANTLYMLLVEWFGLGLGARALVAALGVPVIYGNLAAVLGRIPLRAAMLNILNGALTTLGAAFIIVALLRGW